MWNVNKQNLLNFLILVILFQKIKSAYGGIKEQRKIASGPKLENKLVEISDEGIITTAVAEDEEKFNDYELKRLFIKKFKMYESLDAEKYENDVNRSLVSRKTRDTQQNLEKSITCLSCFAKRSDSNQGCYQGINTATENSTDSLQCFTELHPKYIKRGCVPIGGLNRTFVCNCPLCNDKTSLDNSYYDYKRIGDWEYDNKRLMKPVTSMDLMCKICDTKGINKGYDKMCKSGKDADFVVCNPKQLCYTNIDTQNDYLSRGCISPPVYNSIYFFCNTSVCNNDTYEYGYDGTIFRSNIMKADNIPLIDKSNDRIHHHNKFITFIMLLIAKFA